MSIRSYLFIILVVSVLLFASLLWLAYSPVLVSLAAWLVVEMILVNLRVRQTRYYTVRREDDDE